MLSKFSVKKPYTVVVGVLLVIVLGYIAFTNMSTDLLPNMNMPYVVVYTTYVGATPEQVEDTITRPMEAEFATLSGVKNINSTSSSNLSLVILEFNASTNMDTALVELSSRVDQISGDWDDSVGTPVVMKINPNMLPVSIASVSKENMDIYELSRYVEDTLIPELESVDGVASVSVSGAVEQQISVTVDQDRIDVLNSAILREVDEELADVEAELNDAQEQLSAGKRELARQKSAILGQIDAGLEQLETGETQLPAALDSVREQREQLTSQLAQVEEALEQLENLPGLTPEQKTMLDDFNAQLASLRLQRDELSRQLEVLENSSSDPAAQAEYDAAIARREQLLEDRAGYEEYIRDLTLLDPEILRAEIASLEAEIPQTEASLSSVNDDLVQLEAQKTQLEETIAQLEQQTGATSSPSSEAPGPSATPNPGEGTATPSPSEEVPVSSSTPESSAVPQETPGPSLSQSPAPQETPGPSASAEASTDSASAQDSLKITADGEPASAGNDALLSTAIPEASSDAQPTSSEDLSDPSDSIDAPSSETSPEGTPDAQSASRPLWDNAAYADEGDVDSSGQALELARAALAATERQIALKQQEQTELQQTLSTQRTSLATYQDALEQYESSGGLGEDVTSRLEEANAKISSIDEELGTLEQRIADLEGKLLPDADRVQKIQELQQSIATIDENIAAINESELYQSLLLAADEDAQSQKYAELIASKTQLEAGIGQLDAAIAKLEQGIIPGGFIEGIEEDTDLAQAREQLQSARSQALAGFADAQAEISQADSELSKARREFEEQRDEALENAGLDGIVTMEMVSSMIGAQNFSMPAGYVHEGEESTLVRVGEKFASLAEIKQMKLFSLGLDSIDEVRLLDVATVEITDNSDEVFTKVNGEDGLMLSFEKQSSYSTADVADSIQAKFAELMADDSDLLIVELMNQGTYIDIVVDSVLDNLLSGGALAILVLLLFLMDFRPTIIVALSIPISVVAAFVAMYFSGITLNVLSLSGLALGIGMLVDNSIVAIENIYRLHQEEGYPILRACVLGAKQISGALFASTLTTVCVFLPVVFVEGITKDLLSDLALTITYSLLASLVVALTLVPAACAGLLKRSKPKKQPIFGAIRSGYTKLLSGALRVKPLVLLLAVALLAVSGYQVFSMNMSFMPEVSSPQMTATLKLDSDLTQSEKEQTALEVMQAIMEVPDVESIGVSTESMMTFNLSSSSSDTMSYYITVNEEMERSNSEIAQDIAAKADEMGVDMSIQTSSMDISMLSGSGISVNITGSDLDTLREIAVDVADIVRSIEGTTDISDGLEQSTPELSIIVDKDLANDEGLTVAQVYQFIAQKLVGAVEITKVTLDGKEYALTVAEGEDLKLTPDQLQDLEIEVATEEETRMVRIGDIAKIEESMSLSSISHQSQSRVVSVTFDVDEGYGMTAINQKLEEKLASYSVPEGYKISLSGENETVMEIMDNMVMVIGIALILIFLVMVAQFQSFKSPIIVMFTIPLAFTGGLLALLLTKMDLSVVAMLGFLILAGVIVNNGIVFVDCINQLRIGGMEKREAILETGRMRLRPILMTALTTILGMSTMALGTGMGAEMMQPMAIVTIGGLLYATFMTLFIVPILYDLVNGKKMKAREIEMIRESAGLRSDGELFVNPSAASDVPKDVAPEASNPSPSDSDPAPQNESPSAPPSAPAAPANPSAPSDLPAQTENPPAPETESSGTCEADASSADSPKKAPGSDFEDLTS